MKRLFAGLMSGLSLIALAAADDVRSGEEVVVTAPLHGSLFESLQGATVLKREDIIQRPSGTLGEALAGMPGVSSTFYGVGAGRPIIRGLGDDRIRVLENGIGTIDASSASPDHAVSADPVDAQRIEVLRGAAALAYGGNAVGGVVNVLDQSIPTFAPEKGWSAHGLASYSTVDDGLAGELGATVALGEVVFTGQWSGRDTGNYEIPGYAESAALRAEEHPDDEEHAHEHEHEHEHEEAEGHEHGDEAFGYVPNSATDVRSYSGGISLVQDWGFAGFGAKRFETTYGLPGHEHHDDEAHTEEAEHEHGDPFIQLKQTRYEARGEIELGDGLFTDLHYGGQYADYTHTEFEAPGEPGTVFHNEGFEGRVDVHNLGMGGRLTGGSGIQFSHTDFEAIGDESFIAPTVTRDIGLYTTQRWDRDDWGLEAGLRLETRNLDNEARGEKDFTAFSASAGMFARPADGWFVGATLARTERAPTAIELYADGPHLATGAYEVGDETLDIETATSIEGSLRYNDDIFKLELNLYHIDFDGYIALLDTGKTVDSEEAGDIPIFQFTQRDATFTGGEASLSVRLGVWDGIAVTADAAMDIVDARFAHGGDLPRIPPRTTTLGLTAQTDTVGVRVEAVDLADQDDIAAFETPTDGSTVLNARVTWKPVPDQDITLLVDGRNLTDEEVRVHTSFLKEELPRPGASVRFAISASY